MPMQNEIEEFMKINKITKLINWKPNIHINEGLKRTVEWSKKNQIKVQKSKKKNQIKMKK